MKSYDQLLKINHNPNWPYIPNHPYRIFIIGGSGSGKTNLLLIEINNTSLASLTKFIYALKIYSNECISYLLMEV